MPFDRDFHATPDLECPICGVQFDEDEFLGFNTVPVSKSGVVPEFDVGMNWSPGFPANFHRADVRFDCISNPPEHGRLTNFRRAVVNSQVPEVRPQNIVELLAVRKSVVERE